MLVFCKILIKCLQNYLTHSREEIDNDAVGDAEMAEAYVHVPLCTIPTFGM